MAADSFLISHPFAGSENSLQSVARRPRRSYHEGMSGSIRLALATLVALSLAACTSKAAPPALPDSGPFTGTSSTLTVSGEYKRSGIDAVERIAIEDGKFVLHSTANTEPHDLPPTADPAQQNKGWALVTEGEEDGSRRLTFTHETSLDDFTIVVPASDGQVSYGSLGGRDGNDVLLFAYGSGSKTYWGWATIGKRPAATPAQ